MHGVADTKDEMVLELLALVRSPYNLEILVILQLFSNPGRGKGLLP